MAQDKNQSFPLHKAIAFHNLHKVKILLPKTKEINQKNDNGYTPFLLACFENCDEDILDLILACKDLDINVTDNEGSNALHILALKGNFKGFVKVLKGFPDVDINAKNEKGDTPLIMACKMNRELIVEYLLVKGADVNIWNKKKFSPLHYAANSGYTKCAELLIDYGAKVDVRDSYGFTPLHKASKWGYTDTCEMLLRRGANINAQSQNRTALTCSCYNDAVDLMRLLISSGANVHFPKPYSVALMTSARLGSVECTKELIKAGVDVNGKKRDGKTALDVAKENGHLEIVSLLS